MPSNVANLVARKRKQVQAKKGFLEKVAAKPRGKRVYSKPGVTPDPKSGGAFAPPESTGGLPGVKRKVPVSTIKRHRVGKRPFPYKVGKRPFTYKRGKGNDIKATV